MKLWEEIEVYPYRITMSRGSLGNFLFSKNISVYKWFNSL